MAAAFSFYLIPAAFCVSLVCGLTCLAPLSGTFGASQVSGSGRGGWWGGEEEEEEAVSGWVPLTDTGENLWRDVRNSYGLVNNRLAELERKGL